MSTLSVLHRCHVTSPLRLTQGHHVEDDVLNSSSLLSTSLHPTESSSSFSSSGSHNGENGDQQQKEKTFHYYSAGLPRFTALDAMGWGAAAVLFLQLSRRVHSHLSNCDQSHLREPTQIYRCGYRVFVDLLTRQDVLPRRVNVNCLRSLENQGTSSGESSSFTDSSTSSTTQESAFNHDDLDTDKVLAADTTDHEEGGLQENQTENKKESFTLEDKLTWATKNLQSVTDSSIPAILNIIGIEHTKAEDYQTAFSCFSMAASQGYCKAQFNLGVCYEKGRGAVKNMEKAALCYKQAATAGHSQAQYRYAKYILHSKATGDATDAQRTIGLMEQAAASGLKEAQAYLGVLFTREPYRDEKKAVLYLKMAAQNGDSQSQFNLGQCYERGFGVCQCYRTAIEHYRQAAKAGNGKARLTLTSLYCQGIEEDVVLRSIRSSPCISAVDRLWLGSERPSEPADLPIPNNLGQAALCYKQAATAGHSQAQYRYAKYILHSKATGDATDTQRTIGLMEQAAASGLKEAQAFLGVLFTREPYRDEKKAVLYLKMAAQNGDSQSQFNLGQCYERGFGVCQCYRTAIEHYRQAAKAGNGKARLTLTSLYCQGIEGLLSYVE
ncbi:UNVERIFIED_CONTAM: hypothetical protein FKN15_017121 [Acipenser sinensis]